MFDLNLDYIPEDLKNEKRWVLWKEETPQNREDKTKVPYQINGKKAQANNPNTWNTLNNVYDIYMNDWSYNGIGFMLGNGYIGIDFDDCVDGTNVHEKHKEIIQEIDGYKEVSPSKKGIKCIVYDPTYKEWIKQYTNNKTGFKNTKFEGGAIELYFSGRFFTITTFLLRSSIKGSDRTDECENDLKEITKKIKPSLFYTPQNTSKKNRRKVSVSNHRHQSALLARAFTAKNGHKLKSLYYGDWSGFGSQSEADMSLICRLLYWFGNDKITIKNLFTSSGLYREDKGDLYFDITYENAVQFTGGK